MFLLLFKRYGVVNAKSSCEVGERAVGEDTRGGGTC